MNVSVGQEVIIQSYGKPRRATVVKVARKYFYVQGDREGFDKQTGQGQNGWFRAEPVEVYERRNAAEEARKELRKLGVIVDYSLSPERVLAIHKALVAAPVPPISEPVEK